MLGHRGVCWVTRVSCLVTRVFRYQHVGIGIGIGIGIGMYVCFVLFALQWNIGFSKPFQ